MKTPAFLELRTANSLAPVHIGAASCDAETGIGRVFSGALSERFLGELIPLVGRQILSQVETIAVLTARVLLAPHLANRRVIFWVENDAIRYGS